MKKLFYFLLMITVGFASCKDDDVDTAVTIALSSDNQLVNINEDGKSGTVTLGAEGGNILINVSTNADQVAAKSDDDWCQTSYGAGKVQITVGKYEGETSRGTTVTITAGAGSNTAVATLAVTQLPPGEVPGKRAELDLSETNVILSATGGSKTVKVTTDQDKWDWDQDEDWFDVDIQEDNIIISAEINTEGKREGTITVWAGEGELKNEKKITVQQSSTEKATVETDPAVEIEIETYGGKRTVKVISNQFVWKAVAADDWLTVTYDENEEDLFYVSAERNDSGTERTTTVTVTAGEDGNTAETTVTVTQSAFDDAMIITLNVTAANQIRRLPFANSGYVDVTVDWGDGSDPENFTSGYPSHTYAEIGEYDVRITGTVTRFDSNQTNAFPTGDRNAILEIKQWGDLGITSMQNGFYQARNLRYVADPGYALQNSTSFQQCFHTCPSLTEIPEGLFRGCDIATSFQSAFQGCTGLTSIPSGLFADCSGATTFLTVFSGCSNIEEIPAGLFDGCVSATNLGGAFTGWTKITKIPEGLFDKNIECTTFSSTFSGCSGITEIPIDLFKYNTKSINFSSVFLGTSIREIPQGLFDSFDSESTASINFSSGFQNCKELKVIPAGLLAKMSNVRGFNLMFSGCSSLEVIPEGLMDGAVGATNVASMFASCTSLKTVPVTLFDKNMNIFNVNLLFSGCTALEGESPYTVVKVDGQDVKVHIYERNEHTDKGFTPLTQITTPFRNATFSDYDYIAANYPTWI